MTGLILTGNEFANTIVGLTGNDTLDGGDGNDTLNGGDGNDALAGGDGNDTLNGQNGDDILNGQAGADLMSGGAGNDTYYVDNAADKVFEAVGCGNDTVFAYVNDALQAGQEVETLRGFAGATGLILTGNEFANTIVGLSGNDTLNGGDGNDTLNGGDGNDALAGGNGNDTLNGQNGDDILNGQAGADLMSGGPATTRITSTMPPIRYLRRWAAATTRFLLTSITLQADQEVDSDRLRQRHRAEPHRQRVQPSDLAPDADDWLNGGDGNDTINGGDGNDTLNGGNGNDTINGGDGNDVLNGMFESIS